jgi:hypothetical protein
MRRHSRDADDPVPPFPGNARSFWSRSRQDNHDGTACRAA